MKLSSSLKTLLLASSLLTTAAFAQEQAATEAPATDAAPAADAAAAADVAPVAEAAATNASAEAAAPVADAAAVQEAAPAAPASALSPAVLAAVGTPSAGKALVVFYRPNKFAGGAVGIKIRENETDIVKLQSGQYLVLEAEPGAHAYTVKEKDVTNIETEAGETYFLVGTISMGMMSGKGNLAPSDAAGFEKVLKKLSKVVPQK